MSEHSVAVIDIGSNSIKVLVATRAPDGNITPLRMRTIDARISAGISQSKPRLSEEGIIRGVEAVRSLLADIADLQPTQMALVATSAVRDAGNGREFCEKVHVATGHSIRILSGDEEANLIGRGLTVDPALSDLRDFYVFDLGGGSLECLTYRDRKIEQAVSLPLGCVRLTERFVTHATAPFNAETLVAQHTREILGGSGFTFSLPRPAAAIGTGGTVTTVRAIIGARSNREFAETSPTVTVEQLRSLLVALGAMPLSERQRVPGLPAARADVFPTALATLIAVAELGGFTAFRNSVYNLRYGIAAQLLERA
jgi:exopolyphosphatase / guanosine-5'-triphosphate,3'-diphosphate pyrophosphatase